jgi:hypothetical protein
MISTTPSMAPAYLLGLGGLDVRPAYGPALCSGSTELVEVRAAAPTAPAPGTGLPAGSTALRLRPVIGQFVGEFVMTDTSFENTGTTLGIHSSRRPQS